MHPEFFGDARGFGQRFIFMRDEFACKRANMAALMQAVIKRLKFSGIALHREPKDGFASAGRFGQHIGAVFGDEYKVRPAKKGNIAVSYTHLRAHETLR